LYQLNNSGTLNGKAIDSEDKEFLKLMIDALDIIMDERLKKELVK